MSEGASTSRQSKLNRDHGKAFEARIKRELKELGSYIYAGTKGDVVAGKYIVECKYSSGWFRLGMFKDFLGQAKNNAKWWQAQGDPKQWLIALTGGGKSGTVICMDKDEFLHLWRKANGNEHPSSD